MSRFSDLATELEALRSDGRLRSLVPRRLDAASIQDSGGHRLINFGSNDYLGYATERVTTASVAIGSSASALVTGWSEHHQRLCVELADFESTEAAVLFPSGYAACSGTIATLAREGDLILSDSLNHASLIDGCRLSPAQRIIYPHRDVEFVQSTLRDNRHRFARVWILTESVFSMDGDVAPLVELCEVAEKFGAEMMVDEAHATGVLGPTGSGVCEALDIRHRVAVRIGTLSKAIGSQGGFVVADQVVIDYLVNRCRTLIYSTSLAPIIVDVAAERIREIRTSTARRDALARRIAQFHERHGSHLPQFLIPIIPIVIGECHDALAASTRLRDAGLFVPAIRPPTVPPGTARLRVSLSAHHTAEDVSRLADALGWVSHRMLANGSTLP